MNIVVLGVGGTIGNALHKVFRNSKNQYIGTVRNAAQKRLLGGHDVIILEVDSRVRSQMKHLFQTYRPDYLVNCIGVIRPNPKVGKRAAWFVNAVFPHMLQKACDTYKTKLIHLSTDCVFSGERGNYSIADMPDNRTLYGLSKAAGEVAASPHITIRTSIIGRELHSERNLVDWYLHHAGEKISGYSNVFWNGLSTITLGKIILRIIEKNLAIDSPIIHLAGPTIDKYSLLKIVQKTYHMRGKIQKDPSVYLDRTIVPWEKQKRYFGDLIGSVEDQIYELKKFYPEI